MNEDTVTDLKQFIAATISQQTSDLREDFMRLDHKVDRLEHRVDSIDQKIDDLSEAVVEALDNANDHNQSALDDHEKRITRLESKTA